MTTLLFVALRVRPPSASYAKIDQAQNISQNISYFIHKLQLCRGSLPALPIDFHDGALLVGKGNLALLVKPGTFCVLDDPVLS